MKSRRSKPQEERRRSNALLGRYPVFELTLCASLKWDARAVLDDKP